MKILLYYRYIMMFGATLIGATSCQLTEELEDYEPLYSLMADEAIVDEPSAELALVGIYAGFRQKSAGSGNPEIYIIPDIMSGYAQVSINNSTRPENAGWISNNPINRGGSNTLGAYTRMYDIINRTNWLLDQLDKLTDEDFDTPGRRDEIVGEAKTVRALGHFYLLRLFGEFYDENSEYGINVRLVPAKSGEAFPRNTVAETYTAILDDLDDGIAMGPELYSRKYTNKTFAKALKAKVLLYKGDYAQSATIAKEIIDDATDDFELADGYESQFNLHTSPALFDNTEILFGSAGEPGAGLGIGNFYSGFFAAVSPIYVADTEGEIVVDGQTIQYDEGRVSSVLNINASYGGYWTDKYTSYFSSGDYEMIYHLRMTEVYLIFAEASARDAEGVTPEALQAVNTVRMRSGATSTGGDGFETYPSTITYDQFLTAIRMEKLIELQAEQGETWFDLIRYDYADGFGTGFQVSDVKPSATDPEKFILPIPFETIEAGGNVVAQNPSYE